MLKHGPRVRRAILLGPTAGVPLLFLRVTNDAFGAPKLGLLMIGVSLGRIQEAKQAMATALALNAAEPRALKTQKLIERTD